jgi:hypothetical protein
VMEAIKEAFKHLLNAPGVNARVSHTPLSINPEPCPLSLSLRSLSARTRTPPPNFSIPSSNHRRKRAPELRRASTQP